MHMTMPALTQTYIQLNGVGDQLGIVSKIPFNLGYTMVVNGCSQGLNSRSHNV